MNADYTALAKKVVAKAKKKGAKQAEAWVEVGRDASVRVRDGQIEDLTQATGKGVGLRVFVQGRLGFVYSSDFSDAAIDAFVERAVGLAKSAAANPLNGLPDKKLYAGRAEVGQLFDPRVASLDPEWKIKTALEIEKAGKAFDTRIKTFDSVGAGESVAEVHFANSEGQSGEYEGTYVYSYAVPVATDGTQLQTSYWVDYKRFFDDLEAPESVGKEAARRAVRMLGAKKVKTQACPVVLDPLMSASFIGSVAAAANGDAVFKKSSFLVGKLGQKIAANAVTLVDDGLYPKGLGTAPFDGEGVPTRRNELIRDGVLQSYLYDAFTARKAKAQTTGSASRGYRSMPHIGTRNLYLEPGKQSPEAIIKGVKNGFYVTAMLGHGINLVTGEYSRGANGLWIRDGELAEAVQEVTVAGNVLKMLDGIDAIGNDLTFRGTTGAPTLRFAELAVSGE
jgi:PmbA protein